MRAARRTFMIAPRSLRCSFSLLPGRGSGMTLHAYCFPVSRCVTSLTLEKPGRGAWERGAGRWGHGGHMRGMLMAPRPSRMLTGCRFADLPGWLHAAASPRRGSAAARSPLLLRPA